jgi:hypothetical protein
MRSMTHRYKLADGVFCSSDWSLVDGVLSLGNNIQYFIFLLKGIIRFLLN